VNSYRAY